MYKINRIKNHAVKKIVRTELKRARVNQDIAAVIILGHYDKKYA